MLLKKTYNEVISSFYYIYSRCDALANTNVLKYVVLEKT